MNQMGILLSYINFFSDRYELKKVTAETQRIDVLTTDLAPYTISEKQQHFFKAPSFSPLVQHNLQALLGLVKQGHLTIETLVQKARHNLADLFSVAKGVYIFEGYFSDLAWIDSRITYTVSKQNIFHKFGRSLFGGQTFSNSNTYTIVNVNIVFD